jgi:adenylate cyclase
LDAVPFPADPSTSRVVRTFAFLDLCDFTNYADQSGDEAAVAELKALRSAVREVAPLCGVRVDKWLGDGAMLVGVEVEPVVTATVAVQLQLRGQAHLEMRAGVATGPVLLLEGDDYVGRPVNLAARLCDQAEAGQILAAADGLRVPAWVGATARPSLHVRGLVDPVELVALAPALPEDEGSQPLPIPGPARSLLTIVYGITRPVRGRRSGRD